MPKFPKAYQIPATIVFNITGSSTRKCKCKGAQLGQQNSWKDHYLRGFLKSHPANTPWPHQCVAVVLGGKQCTGSFDVGAHVTENPNTPFSPAWIVPFCSWHNGPAFNDKPIELIPDVTMVGAAVTVDCEKLT